MSAPTTRSVRSADASLAKPDRTPNIWHKFVDLFGVNRLVTFNEFGAAGYYLQGRLKARAGDLDGAAHFFAQANAIDPNFAPALEAHGEVLDMKGEGVLAASKYDSARQTCFRIRRGPPDRPFAVRNRGTFTSEHAAYTTVLVSVKRRAMPLIARGNACLAEGRPEHALFNYTAALRIKPDAAEILALQGEALIAMQKPKQALQAFDKAAKRQPADPDTYSGRAIAHLMLNRLDEADRDWRRQLELLPPESSAARACVFLRMAQYDKALPELDAALRAEPADLYWRLYRLTALRRSGSAANDGDAVATTDWPAPLLALHHGSLSGDEALGRADTEMRRTEARFQLAVLAASDAPERARSLWQQVVQDSPPSMIEHAAARHELQRLKP